MIYTSTVTSFYIRLKHHKIHIFCVNIQKKKILHNFHLLQFTRMFEEYIYHRALAILLV